MFRPRHANTATFCITTVLNVSVLMVAAQHVTVRAQSPAGSAGSVVAADPSTVAPTPSTWKGAITDSFRLLMIEHGIRLLEQKTRDELTARSSGITRARSRFRGTWARRRRLAGELPRHPAHGAAAGFIWLDHEDGAHDPRLGFSKEDRASRGRATAWAAGRTACSSNSGRSVRRPSETSACIRAREDGWTMSSRRLAHSPSWSLKMRSTAIW